MRSEHAGPSEGEYVEVDLSTPEARRAALVDQVTHSLTHHDTMYSALTCALTAYLGSTLRVLLASASIVPLDSTDPYIAATVDRILNNAQIDPTGLVMVGTIATWCIEEHKGKPLPQYLEELRPKRQEG